MSLIPLSHSEDTPWLDQIAALPLAVLYKHSTTCDLSAMALDEMRGFHSDHNDVPVFIVDVLRQRALSNDIETTLRIRHESPQVIVLQNGSPVWNGSHRRVTAPGLSNALRDLAPTA